MAAKMDIDYTCNACGAKGGIHVEVEVDIVLLDVSPEDYKRPEPLGEIPYRLDDEGERPWERPDGVAERAEIEAIEHRERRARRIAMRRSKRNKRLLYRTDVNGEVYSRVQDSFRASKPGSPKVVVLSGENKEN
jgi:hypothetical protein